MDKDLQKTALSSSDEKDTEQVQNEEVCQETERCTSDNESGQGTSGTAEKSSRSASQKSDSTSGIDLKCDTAAEEVSPLIPEVVIDPPSVTEELPVKEERKGFRSWIRRSLSPKKPEQSKGFLAPNEDRSPKTSGEGGKKSFFRKKSKSPNKKEKCASADNHPILQSDELVHSSSSDDDRTAAAVKNLGAIPKRKQKSKETSPNKPDESVSGSTRRFSDSLVRRAHSLIPSLPSFADKPKKEKVQEEAEADKGLGAIPEANSKSKGPSPKKQEEPATSKSRRFSDSVVRCAHRVFPGLSTFGDKSREGEAVVPQEERDCQEEEVPQVKGKVTRVKSKKGQKKEKVPAQEPAEEGEIGRWGHVDIVSPEEFTTSASSVNLDSMSSYKFANFSDANFSDFSDLPEDAEKEVRDASEQMSKNLGIADPEDTDSSGESLVVKIDLTKGKPSVKEYRSKRESERDQQPASSGTTSPPGPSPRKMPKLDLENTAERKTDMGVQTEEFDSSDSGSQSDADGL